MKRKSLLFLLLFALLVPWAAQAQEELTVNDGTTTNAKIPVNGLYTDTQGTTSEFIIPAETEGMSDMEGGTISKVTFYISEIPGTWGSPVIQLYLGEVDGTTLSSLYGPSNFTVVKTMVWSNQQSTIEVEFDEPYTYEGGNLLIGTYVQTAGSYKTTNFYGVTGETGCSRYNNGSGTGTSQNFLPKTTFTYEPAATGDCEKPATLVAEGVTGNSATLTWTGGSGVYNIELNGTIIEENYEDYTYNLTDLAANTAYTAKVQSVCDGSTPTSTWKSVSFTTPCATYDIPYTYGFEDAAPFDCWTVISGTVSRQSGTTNSGSYRLDFRGTASNMIALPQFNEATNNLRVEFYTRPESTGGNSGKFAIGYMTDITDASTFVAVDTYNSTQMTTTYVKKTVDMVNVPANANIAMRQFDCSTNYYWFVDDVTVKEMPSCVAPSNLAANASTTSAELSWTANSGETAWTVYYKKTTDETYTEVANATNPYALNGLDAATNYQYYVVANCSADEASEASEVFSFATACDAITTFPWSEDFESFEASSSGITFNAPCWVNEHISGSGTYFFEVYSGTNGTNSTKQLRLRDMSSGTMTKLMLPEMTLPSNDYLFSIDVYRTSSTANYGEGIRVFVSTDGEIEGATELAFISRSYATSDGNLIPAESTSGWYTYELPIGISGTCYIILRGESLYGSHTYMDNFAVKQMPSCLKPTAFECTATTATSATFSWTASGDETAWQICLNGDEENLIMADSNPFIVEGLTAATAYTAKVRAYCSEEDQSDWSNVASFATACEVIPALGYNENFDSYTAGNNVLPTCWSYINTTTNSTYAVYPRVYANSSYSTYANSAPNCLYFYSYGSSDPQPQYAILPVMEGLVGKQVQLMARGYNATSTFKIGTMTDPADASTFTMIAEQTLTTSYPTDPFEYIIPADCSDSYLAIMIDAAPSGYNTRGVYVDDIVISEAPSCIRPTGLTVSNVGGHSAKLSWTSDGNAWQIGYSTDGFVTEQYVEVTENPYTLTGLAPETAYQVRVQNNCGGGTYSEFTNPVSFTTAVACPAPTGLAAALTPGNGSVATLSWTSDASAWVVAYKTADATDFTEVNVTENPYTLTSLTPETTYNAKVKAVCGGEDGESSWSNTITFTPTDAYTLTVNDGTTTNGYVPIYGYYVDAITKSQFIIPAENLADMAWGTINKMTFYAVADKNWGAAQFEVYMTETDETTLSALADYSTMTKVMNAGSLSISGNVMVVELDAPYQYMGGNLMIGFLQTATGTYSSCSWYGVSATGASMGGYGSSINQQNFLPKTTFDYEPGEEPSCIKPTGLAVEYTGGTEATISWTSDAEAWNMRVNGVDVNGVITNPYTLTGLELATTYSVEVQANCGEDGTSEWSNAVSFTTDFCMPENQCEISYSFYDQYNDSWNGAYMNIVDATTGEVLYELTMPDVDGPYEGSFNVCDGRDIQFVWVRGSYPNECGYEFTHNGETILEKGTGETAPSAGVVLTYTVNCSGASYTLEIEGVGEENWEGGKSGYYLIASPVGTVNINEVGHLLDNSFDLYYFAQAGDGEDNEWINYNNGEDTPAFSTLVAGKGYLYANSENVTLTFTGTPNTDGMVAFDNYDASAHWAGWNLIGNPFADKAYIDRPFYTMSTTGVLEEQLEGTPIEAMEGVFVIADETETTIEFSTEAPAKSGSLALNLTQGRAFVDRAIVRFDEGRELPKFQLNENNTKVFFKQDNKDYAVVNAEGMGDMPVSFKAEKSGSFTMNVTSDEVSFSYLHLIDNMTGADVDLLANPTYSFNASTTDYESRFRLVFATGSSVADDNFGFINGAGNLSIFGIEGTATLQVMDVNGRVLSTETFSGSYEKSLNVAAGVYMLRLINGDNVKVQKVVVR